MYKAEYNQGNKIQYEASFDEVLEKAVKNQDFGSLEELVPKRRNSIKKVFLLACNANDLSVVKWCVARDAGCIRAEEYKGLWIACFYNHIELFQYLFPLLERPNIDGNKALLIACHNGLLELVKLIVEGYKNWIKENKPEGMMLVGELMTRGVGVGPYTKSPLIVLQYLINEAGLCTDRKLFGECIREGQVDNAKYLLEKIIDIERSDIKLALQLPDPKPMLELFDIRGMNMQFLFDVVLDSANLSTPAKKIVKEIFYDGGMRPIDLDERT